MSVRNFDFLSGVVSVGAPMPPAWRGAEALPFWTEPNEEAWGAPLCRVLSHEAFHYWQVLSSGHLAGLVSEGWERLLHFEETGEVRPASAAAEALDRPGAAGFSARDLLECWARYWDVHTRSPLRIAQEEGFTLPDDAVKVTPEGITAYTSKAYDLVMAQGPDCQVYAKPYRWMLDAFRGDSLLANACLPPFLHWAFRSPDPVLLFTLCVSTVARDPNVAAAVRPRMDFIHAAWRDTWDPATQVAFQVAKIVGLPALRSGIAIIAEGPLAKHPVWRHAPFRFVAAAGRLKELRARSMAEFTMDPRNEVRDMLATFDWALQNPVLALALPGLPNLRWLLGKESPPPAIRFADGLWTGAQPTAGEVEAAERRVERFRAAENAVRLGLPPDSFDAAFVALAE